MSKKITVVDLFSGCGGLSLGLQNAGFKVVAGLDNWQPAIETYQKNFDHDIINLDLNNVAEAVKAIENYKPDIIAGGPPCQDFSQAGKRNEDSGRGNLTVSFAQIIASQKPKYFIMENVDRLLLTAKYQQAFQIFKAAGYGLTVKLIDASLCGVPQKRKRWFVIGELDREDNALDSYLVEKLSDNVMTLKGYFGDTLGLEYYYRHPRNYSRRGIYNLDEPSATIRGVNRPLPKNYSVHHLDATKDLDKVRALTTNERALIQTFPKSFIFEGTKTNLEQQIGNAVPVKLAEFVGNALMEYIISNKKQDIVGSKGFEPLTSFTSRTRSTN